MAKPNGSKQVISEPSTRVIQYQQTIFQCSNEAHDARVVYLWRGQWYCRECLKGAIRIAGATALEAYSCISALAMGLREDFRPQAVRRAEPMRCVTKRHKRPEKPKKGPQPRIEFCGERERL